MKKKLEKISITNEEEFLAFFRKIDEYEFITKTLVFTNDISVSFKINGDNFNSSLTGSLITALADYQKKIYHIYKVQKYGSNSTKRLSDDEIRSLEIKVDIKPGCTEAIISFAKEIIPEITKQMTGEEISKTTMVVVGIVAVAWALKGMVSPLIKEAFKTKRAEVQAKVENAKTEKEKEYYESLKSITHDAIEGMRSVATGFKIASPTDLAVDGKTVTHDEIAITSEEMIAPKTKETDNTPDFLLIESDFKVLKISYEHSVTMMTAKDIKTDQVYENISLMDGWLKKENMNFLKSAESRDPVSFRILSQKAGKNKRTYTIDTNSINPDK